MPTVKKYSFHKVTPPNAVALAKHRCTPQAATTPTNTPAKPSALPAQPARKVNKAALPAKNLMDMGLENFKIVEINRQVLKNAEYNPRVINDAEKRKLKLGIKRHGMVAPIVYNKRTGNICGGHQRITALDSLAETKNYTLSVAQIDVDLSREKEINILLNNPQAQGAWDLPKLSELVMDKELNLDGMGFDRSDLFRLLGEDYDTGQDAETLTVMADKVREATQRYRDIDAAGAIKHGTEFYIVVVFEDEGDRTRFLEESGLDDNRYQSGTEIRRLISKAAVNAEEAQLPLAQNGLSKKKRLTEK